MGMRANLLVTRPVWGGQPDPWTEDLAARAKDVAIEVVLAPLQRIHRASPAEEQALVHALSLEASATPTTPLWLVSTSPAAGQALSQLGALGRALEALRERLRFAAIGDATAEGFLSALADLGLAPTSGASVLTAGPAGDAERLAPLILQQAAPREWVLLLEGAENRPDLADRLSAGGLRVLRLPVYTRSAEPMPILPKSALPWWVLITSSAVARPAAEALALQDIATDRAVWIGHHPAIGQAVRSAVPNARWVMVDRLTPSTILSCIAHRDRE